VKKILSFIIIIAVLSAMVFSLSSCDKPEIVTLIEMILDGQQGFSFDADLKITINEEYWDEAMPKEMIFKIIGEFDKDKAESYINIKLVEADGESLYLGTWAEILNGGLYVELNDLSKIIVDFLYSTGFIDLPVRNLFDNMVEYDNGYNLCFDLTDFDMSFFEKYIEDINKIFTIKSSVVYDYITDVNFIRASDPTNDFYFSDIKATIEKTLLRMPGYRYSELYVILETDENEENFMHILATRENGETELLEKVKLDCDLSEVRDNPELIYSANIIPMRYVLELLGEAVGWDDSVKRAYIVRGINALYDPQIYEEYAFSESLYNARQYFDGSLINSKTYISLLQIALKTNYMFNSIIVDEYIEIELYRE